MGKDDRLGYRQRSIGIPDPGSARRGRVTTADWKVAPFYEHIKMNEGEY